MLNLKDWMTVIGLSSLLATIATHLLSTVREHRRWEYENRKLEWRELIDHFHGILQHVRDYDSGLCESILTEVNDGFLLLTNRLFIGDALDKYGIVERWAWLIGRIFDPHRRRVSNLEIFHASIDLQNHLINVADRDLKGWWGRTFHKPIELVRPSVERLEKTNRSTAADLP